MNARKFLLSAALLSAPLFLCPRSACAKSEIKPATFETLVPYQQVFLAAKSDTLVNCDSNSSVTRIVKGKNAKRSDGAENSSENAWDDFRAGDFPISRFTFLKNSGDTLFALATVDKRPQEDAYANFCIERKYVQAVYREENQEQIGRARKEGRGGWGRGRGGRGGGGGGGRGGRGGGDSGESLGLRLAITGTIIAAIILVIVLTEK